jgi:endoglucanase
MEDMVHEKRPLMVVCIVPVLLMTACAGGSSSRTPAATAFDGVPDVPYAVKDYPLEAVSGKTAFEYLRDEKIFSGWNVGNTLDSHSSGRASETGWGNPRINQELMDGVKAAGFDIIRIPVTWMGYIGNAPDYRVSISRLERVAEVVEMAHNAGLKVIINLHHDGATESGGRDLGWLSIGKASRNQEAYNQITSQFVRLWRQIALYFQNYGDWLIFEGFNELHGGNWQTCSNFDEYITLNAWNQFFVDTVRACGGNNESRFLMIAAYCSDYRQLCSGNFIMPKDTAEGGLIATFHYYDPYQFSIGGSSSSWGTPFDRQKVPGDFAPVKKLYIDNNIPVIMGECGAGMQLYPDNPVKEEQARQSRGEYLSYVFSAAKQYGFVPMYWDNGSIRGNGEKFGLLDRRTGKPNSDVSRAYIEAMIRAVK